MSRILALLVAICVPLAGVVSHAAPSARPAQEGPDPAGIKVELAPYLSGLENPVAFAAPNDGSGRLFIVEKVGRIRVVKNGQLLPTPFLDISDRVRSSDNERGLLGLAFHPKFTENGYFVVGYTAKSPLGEITVCRFKITADPDVADPASEKMIIHWAHSEFPNHDGSNIAFGPDNYLYLGTGDGGSGGDPHENGQNGQVFLGKMLRLDIDTDMPYVVPPTNPFVNKDVAIKDEVWALGLRNPWRYSFDRLTGDLYIADVGQNLWEEVDFQPRDDKGGENYGWNVMEGTHCYNATNCNKNGKTLPVAEYAHSPECSITGGYVYRGKRYPNLVGAYFYADYCSNVIWALDRDAQGKWRNAKVGQGAGGIQSFGEDTNGELYVLAGDGSVTMLTDANAPADDTPTPTVAPPTETPEFTPTPSQTAVPPPTATFTPLPPPTGRLVDIQASEFKFVANTVTADPNEALTIHLENVGNAPHDIVFELAGGTKAQTPRITHSQVAGVDFVAPNAVGLYVFYCSVGTHRAKGMQGWLVVGKAYKVELPWVGNNASMTPR